MIRIIFLCAFIGCNFFSAGTNQVTKQVKISVIDFDKIRQESKLGLSINKQAKDMMDNFNKTMTALEENLRKEKSAINPQQPTSRREYSESRENFDKKQDNFVRLSRKLRDVSRNALQDAENEFRRILKKVILKYLNSTNQEVIVLEKSSIIASANINDITDTVLNMLNNSKETIIIHPEVENVGL